MAVAVVSSALVLNSASTAAVYTAPTPFSAVGGADHCVVALITATQNSNTLAVYPDTLATYGGVSMTYAIANNLGGNNESGAIIMYLMNPPTGDQTLEVALSNSGGRACAATIVELSGVDAADPLGAVAAVVTSICTVEITAEAADSVILSCSTARDGDSGPFTPTSDTTELHDYSNGSSNFATHAGMSGHKTGTAASTAYTMGGTPTVNTTNRAAAAAEFRASAGGSLQTITGAAHSSADSFGAGVVAAAFLIAGAAFASADSFGTGAVAASSVIAGAAHTAGDQFGAGEIIPGVVTITGAAFASADAFGSGVVSIEGGPQAISGALFAAPDSFGGGAIVVAYTVAGTVHGGPDAFGAGSVSTLATILGAAHSLADAFGAGAFDQGASPQSVAGASWSAPDAFGAGGIDASYTIAGVAFEPTHTFGAGALVAVSTIGGSRHAEADLFGSGTVVAIEPGAFTADFEIELRWTRPEVPLVRQVATMPLVRRTFEVPMLWREE